MEEVARYQMHAAVPMANPTTATAGLKRLLPDGHWRGLWALKRTLAQRWAIYASEAAISARLRDLRHDGWNIEKRPWPKRRKGGRAVEYRCPLTKETTP